MEEKDLRQISFHGEGSKLFGIYIVNLLLTIVTLGMYYPWAKAAILQYLYQETEFEGSRFTFHGTGKEMFIGFIKAIGIFIVIYAFLIICILSGKPFIMSIGLLMTYAAFILLIPIAIHGSTKYQSVTFILARDSFWLSRRQEGIFAGIYYRCSSHYLHYGNLLFLVYCQNKEIHIWSPAFRKYFVFVSWWRNGLFQNSSERIFSYFDYARRLFFLVCKRLVPFFC